MVPKLANMNKQIIKMFIIQDCANLLSFLFVLFLTGHVMAGQYDSKYCYSEIN